MSKKSKISLVKQLEKAREAIGRERDKLRDMQDDVNTLFKSCEEGYQALDDAISKLSEHC